MYRITLYVAYKSYNQYRIKQLKKKSQITLPNRSRLCFQETQVIGLSAAVIAIICILTGRPISWKKCEPGSTIVWIGWSFHLRAGYITVPKHKRAKLLELLRKLKLSTHCSKKSLERFLGLALWITQLWPEMRVWLHYFYRDLHSLPASQFSVDPGNWDEIVSVSPKTWYFLESHDILRFHCMVILYRCDTNL